MIRRPFFSCRCDVRSCDGGGSAAHRSPPVKEIETETGETGVGSSPGRPVRSAMGISTRGGTETPVLPKGPATRRGPKLRTAAAHRSPPKAALNPGLTGKARISTSRGTSRTGI